MAETPTKDITVPTPEHEAKVDAALAQIVNDDPGDEPFYEAPVREEVPDVEVEVTSPQAEREAPADEGGERLVDDEAISTAYKAFLRDGHSPDEVDAKLKQLGYEKFIARGAKRSKKHATDDEAYAELKQLRTELSDKGTKGPAERGDRPQAGTPPLNLRDLAAPLAERLALDEDGIKALVAFMEAGQKSKDGEISVLNNQLGLVASVLQDTLQDGVRKDLGLDQIEDDKWFEIQKHYDELVATRLHGELSGKPRMSALMKSAAKLAGVTVADPATIQRKASIAAAKSKGAPIVARTRPLPPGPMTWDQKIDHMSKLITQGKFKTDEEARAYSERLHSKR